LLWSYLLFLLRLMGVKGGKSLSLTILINFPLHHHYESISLPKNVYTWLKMRYKDGLPPVLHFSRETVTEQNEDPLPENGDILYPRLSCICKIVL
jgi:hypothetical protein